ncbi:MAG: DUF1080 domain-containing protein [Planctomycetes bacterium]|nr:DUF1080 domain-containing protein [Planctomycetota bacterium]
MVERRVTRRDVLKGAAAAGVALAATYVSVTVRGAEDAAGAKPIFNGKDLTGWDGDPKFWSVQDGAITGMTTKENPTKGNTFIIWRGGTLKDFELRMMFRLENHNSGVQYRSKTRDNDAGKWVMSGYQADMDEANTYTGGVYEEGGRGIVARPGQKVTIGANGKPQVTGAASDPKDIKAAIKNKDWNELVIIARGNHIIQKLNGMVTVDVTDDDEKRRAMEGLLGFQVHAGPPMKVQFKDITLKVLEDK